jgi:hypothetical protein
MVNVIDKNVRAILGLDAPEPREITKNRRGVMIYGHKTAGTLQVMTNESWERNKDYYVARGARSAVKNFSKNICR